MAKAPHPKTAGRDPLVTFRAPQEMHARIWKHAKKAHNDNYSEAARDIMERGFATMVRKTPAKKGAKR